jgi:hypothetical protein
MLFDSVSHHNRAMKVLVSSPCEYYVYSEVNPYILACLKKTS